MKVLFNTYPAAMFIPGGGEVQLQKTREHLQALGVTVDLFNPWEPHVERYDVVHMFSAQIGAIPFHDRVRERGVKLVLSPILWLEKGSGVFPLFDIQHTFNRSDLVLPNSRMEQAVFESFFDYPAEKYQVVYNGIEEDFAPGPGASMFLDAYPFRDFLLCVANVEPRKNQLNLARVCRTLKKQLLLVGGVRDGVYLHQCLTEGAGYVHHLGRLEHNSPLLKSAYEACDAHVLASQFETPGLAGLEAAALGAKIISTSGGSTREYFQEHAHYVDPQSPESIRGGIEAALADASDPQVRGRYIVEHFTWRAAAEQTLAAYEHVLGRTQIKPEVKHPSLFNSQAA